MEDVLENVESVGTLDGKSYDLVAYMINFISIRNTRDISRIHDLSIFKSKGVSYNAKHQSKSI